MVVRLPRRFAPRNDVSRGPSLRMPCNEEDAVRSARPNGQKMAIKIENINKKNVNVIVFEKVLQIAEKKMIMKTSPFFYE